MGTAAEAKLYAGLTWEQIGQATGTTGQAAWQKVAAILPRHPRPDRRDRSPRQA